MPFEELVNHQSGDSFPRPDPTKLTTEQLNAAINALKELFFLRMATTDTQVEVQGKAIAARPGETEKMVDHLKGFIEARLTGMDKAIELKQAHNDKLPLQVDEKISALRLLHEEKFNSIHKQFLERDVRTEQSSKDSKVAVDAALQAAKEAVGKQNESSALAIGKSETATMKQIDQQGTLLATMAKGLDDKVGDIKERMDRMEGQGAGQTRNEGDHRYTNTFYFAVASAVIAFFSLIITLAVVIKHW